MFIQREIKGTGTLAFINNEKLDCTFLLQQYGNGDLFVRCVLEDGYAGFPGLLLWAVKVQRFDGRTESGHTFSALDPIDLIQIHGSDCVLRLKQVLVGAIPEPATTHRFSLTNLTFPGTRHGNVPDSIALAIDIGHAGATIMLRPNGEYLPREELLRLTKQTYATAMLDISAPLSTTEVADIASDLSLALSIVQGHNVNWIDHSILNSNGEELWVSFQNRITKPHTALALNQYAGNGRELPLDAVNKCYSRIPALQAKYAWNGPLIGGWLDARVETDYLQARALKFVIVIETLRTIVLRDKPPRQHLDETRWSDVLAYLLPQLRFFLSAGLTCTKDQVSSLTDPKKWDSVNRKSFRSDINAAFKQLGIKESDRSIELFVHCRNKLIHEGAFRCDVDPAGVLKDRDAPQNHTDEYLFIASFVDRVILQLFGLQEYTSGPAHSSRPDLKPV